MNIIHIYGSKRPRELAQLRLTYERVERGFEADTGWHAPSDGVVLDATDDGSGEILRIEFLGGRYEPEHLTRRMQAAARLFKSQRVVVEKQLRKGEAVTKRRLPVYPNGTEIGG